VYRFYKDTSPPDFVAARADKLSLSEIREALSLGEFWSGRETYAKQSKSNLKLVHTRLWECTKRHKRHTLRIDVDTIASIKKMRGPHGRTAKTRKIKKKGRPASGIRHMLRRRIMLLLHMEPLKLKEVLLENSEYKSGKKQNIVMVMPDLEKAIQELMYEICGEDEALLNHLVFKRMWAPCLSRLIELVEKLPRSNKPLCPER